MPSSPNHSKTDSRKCPGKARRRRLLTNVPEMAVPTIKIARYICQTPSHLQRTRLPHDDLVVSLDCPDTEAVVFFHPRPGTAIHVLISFMPCTLNTRSERTAQSSCSRKRSFSHPSAMLFWWYRG